MDPKALNPSDGMDREHNRDEIGGMGRPAGRSPGAFVFATMRGPRIMLAPDEGAGGGGDGGAGGDNSGAGGDQNAGGENNGGEGGGDKPARPDYIPENFWDPDKGFKADDFNALVAFKAEHDANAAQVPEKADGYVVALPKDFQLPEGYELPEGQESPIDENDPRIGAAREYAHANGFSQAQFEGLIALGAQMDIAETTALKEAATKQRAALGDKADQRINAVTTWLGAKLGGEFAQALAPMMFTAKQIQAFEAIMRLNRSGVPGNPGAGRDGGKQELSDAEYEKMSPAERINYARQASKK
ncbi:hypothetical protein FHT78_005434 [Rhizobium sp. BK196]|uniref:hypothetical protein n=1 Tax=Rhizobium sp. BK196 TaxID=2587073 RepID=UPI0017A8CA51|nr:hypothetical protein [Rhizobium sp. BK196]MBB3313640.1 hypothetical protein [Rhizobium sp. BK196]